VQQEKITEETRDPQEPSASNTKLGRKPFTPTPEQQAVVEKMASFGIPQIEIGKHLRIGPKTLRKCFRQELKHAAYDANNRVLDSLLTMATTRHNVAAAIFWAKTRCGFRPGAAPYENAIGVLAGSAQKKQKKSWQENASEESQAPKVSTLKNLNVYNNEGEPNADY
jgi:hypothetical protein